jgi:hypothetical protein
VRMGRMLVVAVALLVAVGLTFAAGEALKAMGKVKEVSAEKLVLTVGKEAAAKDMTFAVTKETKVTEGDAAKTIADVKVGAHVSVEYTVAGEKLTATAIKVMVPRKKD